MIQMLSADLTSKTFRDVASWVNSQYRHIKIQPSMQNLALIGHFSHCVKCIHWEKMNMFNGGLQRPSPVGFYVPPGIQCFTSCSYIELCSLLLCYFYRLNGGKNDIHRPPLPNGGHISMFTIYASGIGYVSLRWKCLVGCLYGGCQLLVTAAVSCQDLR